MDLDNLDRELLSIVQSGLPVTEEPYRELAEILGTTEEDILARLKRLVGNGTIRRLGGIFDSRRLGYTGTLCAMKVPPEKIEAVAEIVNRYPGVTHNYLRDHDYNMWFTVLAPGKEDVDRVLEEIKTRTGIADLISLPAVKLFKIRVNFDLSEG
ncbi:MAG: AsnC family transcriptional regulator [Peptococcaceae bacterium]|nr:AsnC family transcriptional regulator [Peptococcaceae bacterium]